MRSAGRGKRYREGGGGVRRRMIGFDFLSVTEGKRGGGGISEGEKGKGEKSRR